MENTETTPFDVADHLRTPEEMAAYLEACFEESDGDAAFTKATGLTLDLSGRGMGLRSNRYSMLVKDGKVATLNIEAPGKFEVSDAATMLAQAKA